MNSRNLEIAFIGKIISRILLMLAGVLLIAQTGVAQKKTAMIARSTLKNQRPAINVNFDNEPLPDALHELARKVKVGISYKTDILPTKLVTYRAEHADVYTALDAVLKGTGLYATLSDNRKVIMIKKRPLQKVVKIQSTISGTVTDVQTGKTLPGVNIVVKGTQNGTYTNSKGHYELSVESLQDTLVFSFVGYKTRTVAINGRTSINVKLKATAQQLGELVVSGLASSIKQQNAAHSVAKINAEELTGGVTPSTTGGALEGKVAGANITSTGGAPGGGLDFKLRGISTLGAGSSQPLIIIDGVYLNNDQLSTGVSAISAQQAANQDDSANRLADLNPDDIQSIQILKGPSAAAIYGARANAGVVIIKTKRGQQGATKVSFTQDVGYESVLHKIDRASWSENKIDLVYGKGSPLAEAAKKMYQDAVANDNLRDYQDLILGNNGALINDQLTVSGGDDQTQYLISGEIKRNNGIIENTGFDRNSIRVNLDHSFGKDITIHSGSNYINSQTDRGWAGNGGNGSVIQGLYNTPPFAQILPDAQGNYPANPFFSMNPLELIRYGKNSENANRFVQSVAADIGLYHEGGSDLTFKVNGGLDFLNSDHIAYQPPFLQYQQTQPNPGDVIHSAEKDLQVNLQSFLVYNISTGSEEAPWDLTSQVGYTTFHREQNLQQIRGRGLSPGQTNIENASVQQIYNQVFVDVTDVGFVGQQKANWDDKIIGTVGIRFDKSTLNREQNKYYFFPKASLAMNLTNFDFWSGNLFNQFKLRAAYGETGGLPNFGVTFNELISGNISGRLGSLRSVRTVDPDLKPETAAEFETGVDLAILDNRVSLGATYYRKDVNDLILDQQLPGSSGLQVQATNAADLRNRGIELSLHLVPVQKDKLLWNTTINWSTNDAKITKLKIPPLTTGGFGAALGTFYIAEGYSPTTIVGTPFNEDEGHFTIYGNTQPDFNLSLSNTLNFLHNWKFSFLWQLKYGQQGIVLSRFLQDAAGTTGDWNEDYNNDGVPNGLDRKGTGAERFVADATYLKLRQISLYYTVPHSFLSSLTGNAVRGIRLGISGDNVLLFSPYPGFDPENNEFGAQAINSGVAVAPYPSSRKLMVHVKFDF